MHDDPYPKHNRSTSHEVPAQSPDSKKRSNFKIILIGGLTAIFLLLGFATVSVINVLNSQNNDDATGSTAKNSNDSPTPSTPKDETEESEAAASDSATPERSPSSTTTPADPPDDDIDELIELLEEYLDDEDEYGSPDPDLDKYMENENPPWSVIEPGNLYMRWAENDEFTCGNYDCAVLFFETATSCYGGVYVRASILDGDHVVGWTNGTTGGFDSDQTASLMLENYQRFEGDIGFEVTDVRCHN